MVKNFVFPVLVITAVLIAGCVGVGPGPTSIAVTGTGLEITDFSTEPEEVRSERNVNFIITAEDLGNFKVDKYKTIFTIFLPGDWTEKTDTAKLVKDMTPADPLIDKPADVVSKRLKGKSPYLSKGQTRTDKITARVYYDYQTDSNGMAYIYPEGEEKDDVSSFFSDIAPIRVDVKTSPAAPVMLAKNDYFTLIIDITNVGSGIVFEPGLINSIAETPQIPLIPFEKRNNVTFTIDIKAVTGDGEHTTSSAAYYLSDEDCWGIQGIELYGSPPTATIMCDIEVENIPAAKTPVPIEVNVKYGYYTDKTNSVTILGH